MPRAWASSWRTFSSKRETSEVGSITLTLFMVSVTCRWALAIFDRAMSSSFFWISSSRLARIPLRPSLSLSTRTVWVAICSSKVLTCSSSEIWRLSAILARLSNLSASAALPAARYSSALRDAASAFPPHSRAASFASFSSSSRSRRLPIVWATASSASRMLLV